MDKIECQIKSINQRLDTIQRQLDNFMLMLHDANKERIIENEDGIVETAELLQEHEAAILELADLMEGMK